MIHVSRGDRCQIWNSIFPCGGHEIGIRDFVAHPFINGTADRALRTVGSGPWRQNMQQCRALLGCRVFSLILP